MRVLILAALVACAAAAPSGVIPLVPAVALTAVPTISPGDIQAAAIDAKVLAEDQAQAAIDKARELSEQVVEEQKEKVSEINDIAKEKAEESVWQAVDAIKTAEAKLDGAVANNANAIARSALGGVVIPSYVSPISPVISPVVSPLSAVSPIISPIVYAAPGITAPLATETPKSESTKTEEKAEAVVKTADVTEENKSEDLVKSAEPEKTEAENQVKSEDKDKSLTPAVLTPLVAPGPLAIAPAPVAIAQPWLTAPVYAYSAVQPIHAPVITPVIKTQW